MRVTDKALPEAFATRLYNYAVRRAHNQIIEYGFTGTWLSTFRDDLCLNTGVPAFGIDIQEEFLDECKFNLRTHKDPEVSIIANRAKTGYLLISPEGARLDPYLDPHGDGSLTVFLNQEWHFKYGGARHWYEQDGGWKTHVPHYNTVIVGDSKTYQAMSPIKDRVLISLRLDGPRS